MEDNNNNNDNNDNNENAAPAGISEEQVIKIVNQAVSNHVGRRTKQFDEKFADFSGKIEQLLSAQSQAPSSETPSETDDRSSNETKAFQAQLNKLSEQLQRSEQLREEEKSRNKDMSARNTLKDALSRSGVPAERIPHAMAYLYTEKRLVNYADTGDLEFTMEKDGYTQYLSVQDGVNSFLTTDEGKFYLPPRDVSGSGNKGGSQKQASRRTSGKEETSAEEALRAFSEMMLQGKPVQ